jgi:uroporphyrinogen decarboxylase
MWTRYMEAVGSCVQLAYVTDDLGTQTSLLISPRVYRARIKPFHARLHRHIKSCAPIRLMMHSDGAVGPLIEDLVETGTDILNPVQTSTAGMDDTAALKARFGDRLAFHGAIDVQQMMPGATPEELRHEVARRIADLGADGGYVIAPCHNIGHDIAPERTIAFFAAANALRRHPLDPGAALAGGPSFFDRMRREGAA